MTLKLSEMEKRCEGLPKGEWRAGRADMLSYDGDGYGPYKQVYRDNPNGKMHLGERLPDVVARGEGEECVGIAEFIADARNHLPALIAWAKRARPYLLAMLDGHKEGDPTAKLDPEHVLELEQLLDEVQP